MIPVPRRPARLTSTLAVVTVVALTVVALTALGLAGSPAASARVAPPHPEPPSPVSGPVAHPERDGGHAGGHSGGARGGKKPALLPVWPLGTDVSGHQGVVNWVAARALGAQFVYVKATEGTSYQSPTFGPQYAGAALVGMLHGAYHFALPDRSPGPDQATWFLTHGGAWTNDGKTMSPMIDIEDNPYGAECYGLTPQAMSGWLAAFSNTVRQRTGRLPTIYTSTRWWRDCTGDNPGFGGNPLFLAHYDDDPGPMPASWHRETIWQYGDTGVLPGDQDVARGSRAEMLGWARP